MIDVDYIRINQKNKEDAKLCRELINLLIYYTGDTGKNEGAVDTFKRIIEYAENWNNLPYNSISENIVWLGKNMKIVERLKKRIEDTKELTTFNQYLNAELQRIKDGPKPYEQIQDEKANDDRF